MEDKPTKPFNDTIFSTGGEDYEIVAQLRGLIIQKMTDLESQMDLVIAEHFTPINNNEIKCKEFMHLFLHDERTTLAFKQKIVMYIFDRYYSKYGIYEYHCDAVLLKIQKRDKSKDKISLNTLFGNVVTRRNSFAHRKFDIFSKDSSKEPDLYLWRLKNNSQNLIFDDNMKINKKEMDQYIEEIEAIASVVFEMFIRMRGNPLTLARTGVK